MTIEYELPNTLTEIQESHTISEYNFDRNQLEVNFSLDEVEIIFDLVQHGNGGLFIYEIYFNGCKIGSAWSKSRILKEIGPYGNFVYSDKDSPAFFYSTQKVFRKSEEAMKFSKTQLENPYCFDEYWWDSETCSDAWFPTFDTLQQLIDFIP